MFLKGDILSEQGAISNEMFFLEDGRVRSDLQVAAMLAQEGSELWEITEGARRASLTSANKHSTPYDAATQAASVLTKAGTPISEDSFLFGLQQSTTFVAEMRTTCLGLRRSDFTSVLSEFPAQAHLIRRNALELIRRDDPKR